MAKPWTADDPLTIYLSYDYLAVRQTSRLLEGLHQTHRAVLMALLDKAPTWSPSLKYLSPFELCVQTAYTGDSIEFAFAPKGRFWPRVVYTPEHNLRIESPRWAAPVILMGAAVVGSAHFYSDFLDIELKQFEIQKIQRELKGAKEPLAPDALHALHLAEQLQQVNASQIVDSPNVQRWANDVRRRMHDSNIHVATLNGVPVPASVPMPRKPPPPPQRAL